MKKRKKRKNTLGSGRHMWGPFCHHVTCVRALDTRQRDMLNYLLVYKLLIYSQGGRFDSWKRTHC